MKFYQIYSCEHIQSQKQVESHHKRMKSVTSRTGDRFCFSKRATRPPLVHTLNAVFTLLTSKYACLVSLSWIWGKFWHLQEVTPCPSNTGWWRTHSFCLVPAGCWFWTQILGYGESQLSRVQARTRCSSSCSPLRFSRWWATDLQIQEWKSPWMFLDPSDPAHHQYSSLPSWGSRYRGAERK